MQHSQFSFPNLNDNSASPKYNQGEMYIKQRPYSTSNQNSTDPEVKQRMMSNLMPGDTQVEASTLSLEDSKKNIKKRREVIQPENNQDSEFLFEEEYRQRSATHVNPIRVMQLSDGEEAKSGGHTQRKKMILPRLFNK